MKIILHIDSHDDLALAGRAVRYGLLEMPHKDAIVAYGPAPDAQPEKASFYIKRNKASLTVRKIPKENTD